MNFHDFKAFEWISNESLMNFGEFRLILYKSWRIPMTNVNFAGCENNNCDYYCKIFHNEFKVNDISDYLKELGIDK